MNESLGNAASKVWFNEPWITNAQVWNREMTAFKHLNRTNCKLEGILHL